MKKFGFNFWAVFLPFHFFGIIALVYVQQYWLALLIFWFFIGVIGNGVAAHRYFAHGQFQTWTPVRWVLGVLATLGAIGPLNYWVIQHKAHHLRSDTINDPHSPQHNSWFYVFYAWTFPQENNQKEYLKDRYAVKLAVQLLRDPFYAFFHKHHYKIIFIFCSILILIDPIYFLIYCLAYCIDFFRLGAVNYWCHRSGYRNFESNDSTTNNLLVGWLGMGFGWHNNHHAHPGRLILHHRWWEIDIEGYIAYLIAKKPIKS
jgi:stearoyl-CoA desaturase (delta-9 desaturase)